MQGTDALEHTVHRKLSKWLFLIAVLFLAMIGSILWLVL
jgi:hypothetical protein